jgi:hypothetical protein
MMEIENYVFMWPDKAETWHLKGQVWIRNGLKEWMSVGDIIFIFTLIFIST